MHSRALRQLAVVTLTCLVSVPQATTFSATLREEAVAYRVAGYERQQLGDLEGALAAYQKATALDPTYATPNNDAGILLEGLGRWEDAQRAYERALAIDPKHLEASFKLMDIAIVHQKTDLAIKVMEDAVEHNTDEPLAYYNLINVYDKCKMFEQAEQARQKLKDRFAKRAKETGKS